MKKVFFYILAGLTCFTIFTIFVSMGIGVLFLAIVYRHLLPPIWRGIISLAGKSEEIENRQDNTDAETEFYSFLKN